MSLFSSYRGAEAESFERASKLAVSIVFLDVGGAVPDRFFRRCDGDTNRTDRGCAWRTQTQMGLTLLHLFLLS